MSPDHYRVCSLWQPLKFSQIWRFFAVHCKIMLCYSLATVSHSPSGSKSFCKFSKSCCVIVMQCHILGNYWLYFSFVGCRYPLKNKTVLCVFFRCVWCLCCFLESTETSGNGKEKHFKIQTKLLTRNNKQ